MPSGTYAVCIDWDNDGTFLGTGENVTTRTMHAQFRRGRDVDSQLTGLSVAGSLQIVLNNESGDYNSQNTASPLSGSLRQGRQVAIFANGTGFGSFALTFGQPIFWGRVDRIVSKPSLKGVDEALIEAVGPLGYLNQDEISLPATSTIDTGAAIAAILDEAGWPTGTRYRDIETGKTTMIRWWADREKPIDAMRKVEATEAGFIRETYSGQIAFDNRHHRLATPFTTSQATFTDSPTGTLVYQSILPEDPLPFIFTEFVSTIEPYTLGATGTLWKYPQTGTLSPAIAPNGGTRAFFARFPGPTASSADIGVATWITPAATTDWDIYSDQGGTGTLLNGSSTVAVTSYMNELRIVLTNNATQPGYVTKLQARGVPLTKLDKAIIGAESTSTIFGRRVFPSKARFMPDGNEAKDWADWNLSIYQTANVRLSMTYIANKSTAHLQQALTREIGDRITVIATGTRTNLGINKDFFIEAMEHVIERDRQHRVIYYLSEASAFSDGWVLDASSLDVNARMAY